jgi:hypothetical protein
MDWTYAHLKCTTSMACDYADGDKGKPNKVTKPTSCPTAAPAGAPTAKVCMIRVSKRNVCEPQ